MMEILTLPDPLLREVSKPVERFDKALSDTLDTMLETMYDAHGIGLAGIQVGIKRRIITIDVSGEEAENNPIFLINPLIVSSSDKVSVYEEGCLSIPDYRADVERPASLTLNYYDKYGALKQLEADGLLATCIQHEMDHLDGVLFIDYLSKLKRNMVIKKFTKIKKAQDKSQKS